VAEQVAQGLTNREAAAHLYLSPHTIDYHLRQVFQKLDVRSRVELTQAILRRQAELPRPPTRPQPGRVTRPVRNREAPAAEPQLA
jgi:hypothetical protein